MSMRVSNTLISKEKNEKKKSVEFFLPLSTYSRWIFLIRFIVTVIVSGVKVWYLFAFSGGIPPPLNPQEYVEKSTSDFI